MRCLCAGEKSEGALSDEPALGRACVHGQTRGACPSHTCNQQLLPSWLCPAPADALRALLPRNQAPGQPGPVPHLHPLLRDAAGTLAAPAIWSPASWPARPLLVEPSWLSGDAPAIEPSWLPCDAAVACCAQACAQLAHGKARLVHATPHMKPQCFSRPLTPFAPAAAPAGPGHCACLPPAGAVPAALHAAAGRQQPRVVACAGEQRACHGCCILKWACGKRQQCRQADFAWYLDGSRQPHPSSHSPTAPPAVHQPLAVCAAGDAGYHCRVPYCAAGGRGAAA